MDKDVLLDLAASFEALAVIANKQGWWSGTSHSMVIAGNVNAGLCLEYLAKALNVVVLGNFEKTHDLVTLAAALPEEVRKAVREEYEMSLSDEELYRAKQVGEAALIDVDPDFEAVLRNWSRLFVESRYWFEGKNPAPHSFFFEPLSRAYRLVIESQASRPREAEAPRG